MPPPKSKAKSSPWWSKCDKCDSTVPLKDLRVHECECPVDPDNSWVAPFVKSNLFHTNLDIGDAKGVTFLDPDIAHELAFLSRHVFEACRFVIGNFVIVKPRFEGGVPSVKRVWPLHSPTAPTTVVISQQGADSTWNRSSNMNVIIEKFDTPTIEAKTITVYFKDTTLVKYAAFKDFVKFSQTGKVISFANSLKLSFFGKSVSLKILDINNSSTSDSQWYLITDDTQWSFGDSVKPEDGDKDGSTCIGGLDKILDEVTHLMKVALHSKSSVLSTVQRTKCVLLYGPPGVGKSLACNRLAKKSNSYIVTVEGAQVYSKYVGETEGALKKLFDEALKNSPSTILIDDVHLLCSKRTSSSSEQEHRVLSTMRGLLEMIHNTDPTVFILMATSDVQSIDPSLRRYGRIDYEIEIPVPDKTSRYDIFVKLFSTFSHKLGDDDIRKISDAAHGYVGADIVNLLTQALNHALRNRALEDDVQITSEDTDWALSQVDPSAMKEVLIDIPDVKWTDIGGQEELKLKLRQSIEWPLKHEECFRRFGIKPPSGILMYGPPGCSKTMIAKALANESGLNFISIKGPELFSKWVGESERAVREVFRRARQVAPSIVFFDEIDTLGGERSKTNSGSTVYERVLAQLLTELDGITPLGNVIVVAATNRPDKMDSALLRPGRLDRIIYVPLPDDATRLSIIKIKLAKMPVSSDVSVDRLVKDTRNYSGAEVQAVCHEAALKALEENMENEVVSWRHFESALKTVSPRTPNHLLEIYEKFNKMSL